MRIVNIWGLPLRIVNWSIAILLAACFLTAGSSGLGHSLHIGAGYALSVAAIYRIMLGLIGSPAARFSAMIRPLSQFRQQMESFLQYRVQRWTGHSPMGGMTAMVMLFLMGFAVISGMAALNGADMSAFHAAAGKGAMLLGLSWLGFTVAYQIFYDRSIIRTILSGRRIISDAERGPIGIPRINNLRMHAGAFVWTLLLSAALLPLTYTAPKTAPGASPALLQAMADTPYQYDETRASNDVLPEIHAPVFAVNKVRVTWQSSLSAGIDYARPGYIPGANEFMIADDNTPDAELGSIATAAGDEDASATIPVRAK